ncbi:MAG: S24/S26 family peptidase [Elusimicrobia bacterium]|nr:S24/S26 family peptidase [Elusimicrobiota bacterium]
MTIKAIKLEGASMFPLFKDKDVVFVSEVRSQMSDIRYKKGDCVVYNFEGKKLLHRVTGIENDGAWISDDAGIIEPHFVKWEDIEGKVLSKNPFVSGIPGMLYSKIRKIYAQFRSFLKTQ